MKMPELIDGRLTVLRTSDDCILSKGFGLEDLKSSDENRVIEISPCASERGKVMGEIDLSGENRPFLDMETLCLLLSSYKGHFANLKCSTDLGVALFMWKARRIYIYEKGKFKIRFAHSREDAERVLDSLGRLILGSVLCEKCDQPSLECVLGECGICLPEKPEVVDLKSGFNAQLLSSGIKSFSGVLEKLQELKARSLSEKWPVRLDRSLKRKLEEAVESGMNFALEARSFEDLKGGVTLIGVARENLLMLDFERELVERKKSEIPERLEELLDKFHRAVWGVEESVVGRLFGIGRTSSEEGDAENSAPMDILSEIMSFKDQFFEEMDNDMLKSFERRVRKVSRCNRLLKNTGGLGS